MASVRIRYICHDLWIPQLCLPRTELLSYISSVLTEQEAVNVHANPLYVQMCSSPSDGPFGRFLLPPQSQRRATVAATQFLPCFFQSRQVILSPSSQAGSVHTPPRHLLLEDGASSNTPFPLSVSLALRNIWEKMFQCDVIFFSPSMYETHTLSVKMSAICPCS